MKKLLMFFGFVLSFTGALGQMADVKGGDFLPLYGSIDNKEVFVKNFKMDKKLVTNADYLKFVKKHPQWQKSKAKRLFADKSYLKNWSDDVSFAKELENTPVTNVSWYAAKAYCEDQGKKLPSTNQWEYAAMAGYTKKDARKDSLYNARIIAAYEEPKTYLKQSGLQKPNFWGIYDMNELVWEWTSDFSSIMISGENRDNNDMKLFCGAGSLNASDLMNYAAFMRYAFRSSIKANYTITNLGFRCIN
jgi:sulfatase modifying factor 1